jgi:hypothetical protein
MPGGGLRAALAGAALLVAVSVPAGTDPDLIPPSGIKFESLKLKPIPAYRPFRDTYGNYLTVTRREIVEQLRLITGLELHERGSDLLPPPLPRISCRYERYSAVSDSWFKEFTEWYRRELWRLDLNYRKESWDCDDFSVALNAFADLALLLDKEHPPPQLIGRLVVRNNRAWAGVHAGGVHEIVIFYSGSTWHVYEPQSNTIGTLWEYPNRTFVREVLFN